jgi:phenylalanyl-tRNA synthetase beta chain
MKLSSQWIRDFVDLTVDDRRLADDLTNAGIAVEGISGEGKQTVFEMEIGTNRPDAMNHYGVAREAAAIYGQPLKPTQPKLPGAKSKPERKSDSLTQTNSQPHPQSASAFPIEIKDPVGCARFTARIIRSLSVKPSPAKIVERLALLDQRAINNAADATNYVLWEMGKPTHVFDLDLLEGGKIIVRRARDGEKLKTLDGVERKLTAEDLVVADAVKPVGLAGTMGGFDTMITGKTKNILIESAWWDPVTVRKMARRHGLHTDASHRFERGADFESTIPSCDRVAELILQSGGGELDGEPVDVVARWLDQAPVGMRMAEVHRILGDSLDTNQVVRILQRLGFEVLPEPDQEPEFTVRVPSWRLDIEREIDLIEEIARLHGYDKFENTLPAFSGSVIEAPDTAKDRKLRGSLLGLGYDEAVSLTFISHDDAQDFCAVPVIEIANPLSEEASVMRTSLVPGMLNMLAYNLNRGSDNLRLFETGSVFEAENAAAAELRRICMGASGNAVGPNVHQPARPFSFFDLKGDLETLLHLLQHDVLTFDAQTAEYYHPGRSARAVMDGATVAQFGQLHPETAAKRKFKHEVFIAELYLDRLYQRGLREVGFEALPRFPAVERDFSFVFADSIAFEQVRKAVSALRLGTLRSLVPVEIFRGEAVPAGKYSLLLRAMFQSDERTLREDEVARWSAQVVKALEGLGGALRMS